MLDLGITCCLDKPNQMWNNSGINHLLNWRVVLKRQHFSEPLRSLQDLHIVLAMDK
jgi:hypothetical protein